MFIAHRIPPLLGDEAPDDSHAAKLNGYHHCIDHDRVSSWWLTDSSKQIALIRSVVAGDCGVLFFDAKDGKLKVADFFRVRRAVEDSVAPLRPDAPFNLDIPANYFHAVPRGMALEIPPELSARVLTCIVQSPNHVVSQLSEDAENALFEALKVPTFIEVGDLR